MKRIAPRVVVAVTVASSMHGVPAAEHTPTAPAPVKPLDLSPATIRQAITSSKRPEDDVHAVGGATFGGGAPPTRAASIDRAFKAAQIPTCMTADAWRFEAPSIGGIGFGGLLALPFWAHVVATGKCRH